MQYDLIGKCFDEIIHNIQEIKINYVNTLRDLDAKVSILEYNEEKNKEKIKKHLQELAEGL